MILLAQASEESLSYHLGQWTAVLLFSIPAAACLQKVIKSPPGSLRYSYLSALMGLLLLVQIELPLDLRRSRPGLLVLIGLGRGLLAAAGLIFMLRALLRRRVDRAVGAFAPCVGGALSALHGFVALSMIALPSIVRTGAEGEPWTYRSESDDYSITLPSRQWAQAKMEGASSAFTCRILQARVAVFTEPVSREQFLEVVQRFKTKQLPTLREGQSEEGKTPAGHEYFLGRGFEKVQDKEVFVTIGLIYKAESGRILRFLTESSPSMSSMAGQASQASVVQDAARSVFLSLK